MCSEVLFIYILFIFDLTSSSVIYTGQRLSADDLLICKLQPNGYACSGESSRSKFYFDIVLKTCSTFEYGYCDSSQNQFNTLHECNAICFKSVHQDISFVKNLTTNLICRLQPDFGDCQKYYPMYYFDVSTHRCKGFSYSGCGGNGNRFVTKLTCKDTCTDWIPPPKRIDRLMRRVDLPRDDLTKPILNLGNLTVMGSGTAKNIETMLD